MSRFAPYIRSTRFIAVTLAISVLVYTLATRYGLGQSIFLRLDKDQEHGAAHTLRGRGLQPDTAYTVMLATDAMLRVWRDIAVVGGGDDVALLNGLACSNVNQFYRVRESDPEDPARLNSPLLS